MARLMPARVSGDPGGGRDRAGRGHHGSTLHDQASDPHRSAAGDHLNEGGRASRASALADRPLDQRRRSDRGGCRPKRRPGAVDEATDGTVTQPERVGDLVVATALERGAEHHLALEFRKRCQTGERGPDLEPPLDFVPRVAGLTAVLDV